MRQAHKLAACLLAAALSGCRTPPPPPPPPPAASDDSAADWHPLLVAPFGSVLKEVPLTLHEVLLFRDDAKAAADEGECYATDAKPPPLLGRTPEDYILCFKRDRLARIKATLRLSSAEAAQVFAQACAAWLRHATAQGSECEGQDAAVHFVGRLGEDADVADKAAEDTTLSLTLEGLAP